MLLSAREALASDDLLRTVMPTWRYKAASSVTFLQQNRQALTLPVQSTRQPELCPCSSVFLLHHLRPLVSIATIP